MRINLIAAVCEKNMGIGQNNAIPWKNSTDMKFFSKTTKGNNNNAIIMGTYTWLSLPSELPNRLNIIIGSSVVEKPDTVLQFKTIPDALHYCKSNELEEVWVIGGSKIYDSLMSDFYNKINEIVITWIKGDYPCDRFFPNLNNFKNYKTRYIGKDYNLKVDYFKPNSST